MVDLIQLCKKSLPACLWPVLHRIVATDTSSGDVVKLVLYKLLTYASHMVDIELALQMVALMLNYTRKESAYLLFMRLKVLILPTQEYMLHPLDVLGKARQAQAAFPAAHRIAIEHFYFRIYKHKLTSDRKSVV